jgi:hypothetical protein
VKLFMLRGDIFLINQILFHYIFALEAKKKFKTVEWLFDDDDVLILNKNEEIFIKNMKIDKLVIIISLDGNIFDLSLLIWISNEIIKSFNTQKIKSWHKRVTLIDRQKDPKFICLNKIHSKERISIKTNILTSYLELGKNPRAPSMAKMKGHWILS